MAPQQSTDSNNSFTTYQVRKMALQSALARGKAFLTPRGSTESIPQSKSYIFPKVDPAIDGEDCDHDCATCEIQYPKGFKIDEEEKLYGHVNGWATHMLVATGKTDWVKDVSDEKGSVMEAVRDCKVEPTNGTLMLSASNMPLPTDTTSLPPSQRPTTILLLPSFTYIDNVTPTTVPSLITHTISTAPTTTTPLSPTPQPPPPAPPSPLTTRPCPHTHLILLCSQRTRDARCGQSAPLLKREFERHLRPLGLLRDQHDDRPGGVGILFISHVGGHKFSANVMVYRRGVGERGRDDVEGGGKEGKGGEGLGDKGGAEGAAQCIWLARVRPEDCEGIVKFTVLKGKVVKPERQLRGGFDRGRGVVSW
ncbi:hypothetical protein ACLMJK_005507 [Lecanora helva]